MPCCRLSPLGRGDLATGTAAVGGGGVPVPAGATPHATYLFKHALIQDTAYQSLLESTRQQYHQRIAQVLVERFPGDRRDAARTVGASLTEAGLNERAALVAAGAGQRALEPLGPRGSHRPLHQRASITRHASQTRRSARARSWRPERVWVCRSPHQGAGSPGGLRRIVDGRGNPSHDIGKAPSIIRCFGARGDHIRPLPSWRRRRIWRINSSTLYNESRTRACCWRRPRPVDDPIEGLRAASLLAPRRATASTSLERHHRHVFTISDHDVGFVAGASAR